MSRIVKDHDPRIPSGKNVVAVYAEYEFLQYGFGAFVTAVFAPGLTERLQLHIHGVAALFCKIFFYDFHFVERQVQRHVLGNLFHLLVGGVQKFYFIELVGSVAFDQQFFCHMIISQ